MTLDKGAHLQHVLETHRMSHIEELVQKHISKRDEIKEAIENEFSGKIYTPFNSGSFGKHTAINIKFDLDLVAPFKRNAFDTIEKMFDTVCDFLKEKFEKTGLAEVRKQKVSIGVLFYPDKDGDEISIDLVPGRELNTDSYAEDKSLNIYFNESLWGFTQGSYTKTNIHAQIDHIKAKESERKIIRLLKIWKNTNNEKNYKSFLLELITIKAFDKVDTKGGLWEKLKAVLTYIKDNVAKSDFTLKDPGNSNNDVITSLEQWQRDELSRTMERIIQRIEDNPENIKAYFPANDDFAEDSKSNNSYGIKGPTIVPSIPSNNKRFG